ncbi:MAG: single-stranded DNA-binding protein [Thermocrispum sp.]
MAMGETIVTVNGRIVTDVERRDVGEGSELAGFLVISTERRFDKNLGDWVDGRKFSVWVTCWRRLARNVALSLTKGDDVMVSGRLRTREYEDGGKTRYATELDAYAVGPNLTRAIADVRRIRSGEPVPLEQATAA